MAGPIIIGGNGHSGTRIFAEILMANGVFMGINGLTRSRESCDLKILDLFAKWNRRYLVKLTDDEMQQMRRDFERRLRLYFPFRPQRWGFKNPRSMLLLPFFHELFPHMRFIHVIRDGRDLSFGNEFVDSPRPPSFLSSDEERLSPEETMILFWGRSNRRAMEYGQRELKERYLMIRFEDLCDQPRENTKKILEFADCSLDKLEDTQAMVKRPSSIGRWRTFNDDKVNNVISLGKGYLEQFGYTQ